MKDGVLFGLVVLGFAGALTFHLTLLFGLARREPRRHALIALFVPPLAPFWGFTQHMRVRAVGWIASVCLYVAARLVQGG